jgi:hypothetical protein
MSGSAIGWPPLSAERSAGRQISTVFCASNTLIEVSRSSMQSTSSVDLALERMVRDRRTSSRSNTVELIIRRHNERSPIGRSEKNEIAIAPPTYDAARAA